MSMREVRLLMVAVCIVTLPWLASCSREQPTGSKRAAALPSARPAARLLTARVQPDGVEWLLQDAGGGLPQSLGLAAADAVLWALDDSRGDFYYVAGDAVWRDSWRNTTEPAARVAGIPAFSGIVHAVWIDLESGELTLLEMRQPTSAEALNMNPEPPDARPFWALLWRLHEGRWSTLHRRATSWGSEGAVGPSVFADLRHERGRSVRSVQDSASCPRVCNEPAATPTGVDISNAEEWRELPGSGGNLIFGVALGDTWHVTGPLIMHRAGYPPRALAPGSSDALLLDQRDGHLLVSQTLLPAVAVVINLSSGARRELESSACTPVWVE